MLKRFLLGCLPMAVCTIAFSQFPTAKEIKTKKIKKISISSSIAGSPSGGSTEYFYDAHGNDTARYYQGERASYNRIVYDGKNRIKTITAYAADGKQSEKTTYTYKPDGSFTTVNIDDQFGLKVTDVYDKNGVLQSHTIPDGSVFKYVYNNKGLLISSYNIPANGATKNTAAYVYDAKGKLVSEKRKGDFNSSSTYEYDAKGLLKKRITTADYSGETEISTSEYQYHY